MTEVSLSYALDMLEICLSFAQEKFLISDADMEKVANMQALLANNYSENCRHFWINK